MKYRKLGKTDLDVSVICLGTMTYGEQNTQQDGFDQMDYAFEKGINFLILRNYIQLCQVKKHLVRQKK